LYSVSSSKFGARPLKQVSSSCSKALQAVPLERPGLPGRQVLNPVCEYMEASWLGVARLVPQFTDGITMDLGLARLSRMSEVDLLPGEVLICSPDGEEVQGVDLMVDKLSESVRLFTRGIFTHAAIVGRDKNVYEAVLPVIKATPFNTWVGGFRYVVVLRHSLEANALSSEIVCNFLEMQVGRPYNIARAIGIMLVGQMSHRTKLSVFFEAVVAAAEKIFYRGSHVCSTLVWSVLATVGLTSPGDPFGRYVTPAAFIDQALLEPVGYATAKHRMEPHRLDASSGSYE